MKIETPADAFAAAAVLMVGADRVGTPEERHFIFDRMSTLQVFHDMNAGSFMSLIARTTDDLVRAYPVTDARLSDESVAAITESIGAVLDAELRSPAGAFPAGRRSDGRRRFRG